MINFCIGDIIEHKYKLLEEKAQGGMNSILYRAQNLKYDKNIKNSYEYVMVKIVNLKHWKDLNDDEKALCNSQEDYEKDIKEQWTKIQNEIQINNRLSYVDCINIAHFVESIQFRNDPDTLAIVIEYVDGDDLETILEKREKLSVSESLHIARQILVALSKIHQNRVKIIHRDLKPNNVMICRDARSTVKLIDFGISTIVDDKTILSNESNIYGASQYVSPEVMKAYYTTANKKSTYLTERIDFFAFGIIFYQMLMGHDPFFKDGFNDTETINLSLHYDIFPMHTENSLIPSAIENIILRCLSYAKNKKIRYYKNADEIIQDIDQVLVKNKSHSFVNPNKRNFNSKQIFVIKNNLDLLIFFRPWFITLFSVITILTITIVLILIYLK